jgi:alkylation response protein AidB-like acyl-CoA dehydrogenase
MDWSWDAGRAAGDHQQNAMSDRLVNKKSSVSGSTSNAAIAYDSSPESVYGEELEMFRASVRAFLKKELEPHVTDFDDRGLSSEFWREAGAAGLLGVQIPEAYGGPGADPLAVLVVSEELGRMPAGASIGSCITTDIMTGFLVDYGTEEQKQQWFPGILTGDVIQSMALTEPESGSDAAAIRTNARRDGDHWVINGAKCFMSNGAKANLVYVICKTDPAAGARGMSAIMVPGGTPGFTQRPMKTMGYRGGDTGELFFDNVRVPTSNLLGVEGGAMKMFQKTIALDRLQVAARSQTSAEAAFDLTLEHTRNRKLFKQRLLDFQNTQFKLAESATDIMVGKTLMNEMIKKYRAGQFTERDGSMVKLWITEMEGRVLDVCLQLWGGSGWMDANPISRMYTAARVTRIFVGPNDLQKHLIARPWVRG